MLLSSTLFGLFGVATTKQAGEKGGEKFSMHAVCICCTPTVHPYMFVCSVNLLISQQT